MRRDDGFWCSNLEKNSGKSNWGSGEIKSEEKLFVFNNKNS